MKEVKCWTCKHRLSVPGSALIACAWKRKSRKNVRFYEGFDSNYPYPIFECKGYEHKGEL